jgi:hypothetical protein
MSISGTGAPREVSFVWRNHLQNARVENRLPDSFLNSLLGLFPSTYLKTTKTKPKTFTFAPPLRAKIDLSLYKAVIGMANLFTFPLFKKAKETPTPPCEYVRSDKPAASTPVAPPALNPPVEPRPVLSPERIHARALSCPDVRALYDEACREGEWIILFEAPISGPRAQTLFDLRTILIDPNLSENEALSSLIFELTNATKAKVSLKLNELARHNRISREEYVRQIERAEHAGALTHHAIVSKAVKELGWHPDVDRYAGVNPDFEAYWPRIANSEHAERYRLQWDSLQPAAAAAAASLV